MTFAQLLGALRRRWRILVVTLLAALLAATWQIQATDALYESSTTLFVDSTVEGGSQESLASVQLSQSLLLSYARIAMSDATLEELRTDLGLQEDEPLGGTITAGVEPSTLLILLTATSPDPDRALLLAERAAVAVDTVLRGLRPSSSESVTARVIDRARLPDSPASPRPLFSYAVALLAGAVLALLLAALRELTDRSVRTIADAQDALGVPALAIVPHSRRLREAPLVAAHLSESMAEPFRALRTTVRFAGADAGHGRVLVTSPKAAEGKTLVAANLAVTLAQSGERVCLVDADLRRPGVAAIFGLDATHGLASVITGQATLEASLIHRHGVALLPAGPRPSNPSELLGSVAFYDILEQLSQEYETVVIDAPPVLPVTDAVVLSVNVDQVLVVLRQGRTTVTEASRSREILTGVDAPLAGFVLNGATGAKDAYYGSGD